MSHHMTETTSGWTPYRNPARNPDTLEYAASHAAEKPSESPNPGLFISIIYMSTLPPFMESRKREDEREKGKKRDAALFLPIRVQI